MPLKRARTGDYDFEDDTLWRVIRITIDNNWIDPISAIWLQSTSRRAWEETHRKKGTVTKVVLDKAGPEEREALLFPFKMGIARIYGPDPAVRVRAAIEADLDQLATSFLRMRSSIVTFDDVRLAFEMNMRTFRYVIKYAHLGERQISPSKLMPRLDDTTRIFSSEVYDVAEFAARVHARQRNAITGKVWLGDASVFKWAPAIGSAMAPLFDDLRTGARDAEGTIDMIKFVLRLWNGEYDHNMGDISRVFSYAPPVAFDAMIDVVFHAFHDTETPMDVHCHSMAANITDAANLELLQHVMCPPYNFRLGSYLAEEWMKKAIKGSDATRVHEYIDIMLFLRKKGYPVREKHMFDARTARVMAYVVERLSAGHDRQKLREVFRYHKERGAFEDDRKRQLQLDAILDVIRAKHDRLKIVEEEFESDIDDAEDPIEMAERLRAYMVKQAAKRD